MHIQNHIARFRTDRRFRNLVVVSLLIVGVATTVLVSQTAQNLTTKASQNPATLLLSPESLSVKKNELLIIKLLLKTEGRDIMGVDTTIRFDKNLLSLDSFNPTQDFSDEVINSLNTDTGEFHYVIVDTEDKPHTDEVLDLGTLRFTAKENGYANVRVTKSQVVALGSNDEVPLAALPEGTYSISDTGQAAAPSPTSITQEENADLVPVAFSLTDSKGIVKDHFAPGEAIYTLITLTNKGTKQTRSDSGYVYSYIYPDSPTTLEASTPPSGNVFLRNGLFSPGYTKTYGSFPGNENIGQYRGDKFFTNNTEGVHTARIYMNYDHKAAEDNFDNNQLTTKYLIRKPTPEGIFCLTVMTPARNSQTNECWVFTDSCIPDDWIQDDTCK